MTSVPKPLKFLTEKYEHIKDVHSKEPNAQLKTAMSDLVSVIGMVSCEEGSHECLKYCLTGSMSNHIEWGHEYLRCLAGEIGAEYNKRTEKGDKIDDLMKLVN